MPPIEPMQRTGLRPATDRQDVGRTNVMVEQDLPHPIIERPHEYRILSMRYDTGLDEHESFLDLHLGRGVTVRKLRFWSPQSLKIEEGVPEPTSGMTTLDVGSRQMDGLGVRVADSEVSWGAITFWARDVVGLDTIEADQPADADARRIRGHR